MVLALAALPLPISESVVDCKTQLDFSFLLWAQ